MNEMEVYAGEVVRCDYICNWFIDVDDSADP